MTFDTCGYLSRTNAHKASRIPRTVTESCCVSACKISCTVRWCCACWPCFGKVMTAPCQHIPVVVCGCGTLATLSCRIHGKPKHTTPHHTPPQHTTTTTYLSCQRTLQMLHETSSVASTQPSRHQQYVKHVDKTQTHACTCKRNCMGYHCTNKHQQYYHYVLVTTSS